MQVPTAQLIVPSSNHLDRTHFYLSSLQSCRLLLFAEWKVELQQTIQTTNPMIMAFSAVGSSSAHNGGHTSTAPSPFFAPDFLSDNSYFHASCQALLPAHSIDR
ncbi:hypothetical protein KCU73_g13494, partial [Aureobasidium melanogenum]